MLQNRQKNRLYNPIRQKSGHIKRLKKVVGIEGTNPYKSYIIFSERCELKKITLASPDIKVIKRNALLKAIKADIVTSKKYLTYAQVD